MNDALQVQLTKNCTLAPCYSLCPYCSMSVVLGRHNSVELVIYTTGQAVEIGLAHAGLTASRT